MNDKYDVYTYLISWISKKEKDSTQLESVSQY